MRKACSSQFAVGFRVTRAATISRVLISNNAKIYSCIRNAVSTVIKSHAKARFAWLFKNGIQVSSNLRADDGKLESLRILQTDDFDRVMPIFLYSPLIRRAPQRGLLRFISITNNRIFSSTGGRPNRRWLKFHLRRCSWRCHFKTVDLLRYLHPL